MIVLVLQAKNVVQTEVGIQIPKVVKIIVETGFVKNPKEKVVVLVKMIVRNAIYLLVLVVVNAKESIVYGVYVGIAQQE